MIRGVSYPILEPGSGPKGLGNEVTRLKIVIVVVFFIGYLTSDDFS